MILPSARCHRQRRALSFNASPVDARHRAPAPIQRNIPRSVFERLFGSGFIHEFGSILHPRCHRTGGLPDIAKDVWKEKVLSPISRIGLPGADCVPLEPSVVEAVVSTAAGTLNIQAGGTEPLFRAATSWGTPARVFTGMLPFGPTIVEKA